MPRCEGELPRRCSCGSRGRGANDLAGGKAAHLVVWSLCFELKKSLGFVRCWKRERCMRTNKNRLESTAEKVLLALIMLGALEVAQRVLALAEVAEALPARVP
jgi:hypothetical protein